MSRFQVLIILAFFVCGCGNKSVIKNAVKAQTTAEAYGDGEFTILPLVLPLSDQEISSFDSPLGKIGFVAGGFAKMFMNLGASMGMGKVKLSLIQQVPEMPKEYFKSAKVKRIFFYIEPKKIHEREMSWFQRVFNGRENVNFKFLDKIAVKLSSHHVENTNSWIPLFDSKTIEKKERTPLQNLFEKKGELTGDVNLEDENQVILVKYDGDHRNTYLQNDNYGKIYIINTHEAALTRDFLMNHPKLKGYFKRIHILNNSILLELEKDPILEEGFNVILAENAVELEKLGVKHIEPCTKETCMDLKIPDINLAPLIMKDNAIKMDAFIEAGKVPDSFQLKGFIEFEIKLKLTF
ncbi:MAG TPA: hypothetical protein VNJ08_08040 [Bacteriovoracaceae bacterium]|nr:hypothetical protein [Bacteriovoracaceae bacterium]